MARFLVIAALVAAGLASPGLAHAEGKPVYVTGGAGYLDFRPKQADPVPTLQLDILPALRGPGADMPLRPADEPPPLTGAAALQGGRAVELGVQMPVGESFTFTPSIALGRGDTQIEPNSGYEYRSGATLSYQFQNDWRLGASIYHYTDGRAASERDDAGAVTFSFTVPIGR
ncbi:hypothetical protein [Arenibaculum pallidiluteum]|uniref:hypothetical protein n=1 Tax=Arenibaculum pallidiluteum TaxID=2812559 RepID=UPI001A96B920|nr:hypothetical protein [Arenibaculum pallidiluteum]